MCMQALGTPESVVTGRWHRGTRTCRSVSLGHTDKPSFGTCVLCAPCGAERRIRSLLLRSDTDWFAGEHGRPGSGIIE